MEPVSGEQAPLSSMSRLVDALKETYRRRAYIKRLFEKNSYSVLKSYLNLMIRESATDEKKKANKSHEIAVEKHSEWADYLSLYEAHAFSAEKEINPAALFDARHGTRANSKAIHRIVVEGRAGIGKTTFCAYLAAWWAQQWQTEAALKPLPPLWPAFDLILWVPLKKLIATKAESLDVFLYEQCLDSKSRRRLSPDDFVTAINSTTRILYLLDGYDEVSDLLNTQTQGASYLASLLEEDNIILTSRLCYVPNHLQINESHYGFDRRVEIMGFKPEEVNAFIELYFAQTQEAALGSQLQTAIKQNGHLQVMARVPINAELLCSVWRTQGRDESLESIKTLTPLYQQITANLFKRYLVNSHNQPEALTYSFETLAALPELQSHYRFIECLAWCAQQNKDLEFIPHHHHKWFKHLLPDNGEAANLFIDQTLNKLGFLTGNDGDDINPLNRRYYFIHLTFQEYFAACYLVRCLREERAVIIVDAKNPFKLAVGEYPLATIIAHYRYHPRYQMLWRFMAGLLKEDNKHLETFWNLLNQTPRDAFGFNQLCSQLSVLEECWQVGESVVLILKHAETASLEWAQFRYRLEHP